MVKSYGMVIPVGTLYQELKLITKTKTGIEEESVIPVRFVPMIKSNPQMNTDEVHR